VPGPITIARPQVTNQQLLAAEDVQRQETVIAVVASVKAALFWVRKEHLVWQRALWQLAACKGGSTVMTAFLAGVKNPSSSMVPVGAADE
jgi:hypothetical protein